MNIDLHIEQLVLAGIDLPHGQRPVLQEAVQAELARLLADGGISGSLAQGAVLSSVRPGSIQVEPGSDPGRLGGQIARAVYGGIGQ